MIDKYKRIKKFSLDFAYKITSRRFWIWLVTTGIVIYGMNLQGEKHWMIPIVIIWGVVSVFYYAGDVISDALAKSVEKMNISVTANNTINTNIQASAQAAGVKNG